VVASLSSGVIWVKRRSPDSKPRLVYGLGGVGGGRDNEIGVGGAKAVLEAARRQGQLQHLDLG
jgi:hypothetical protein